MADVEIHTELPPAAPEEDGDDSGIWVSVSVGVDGTYRNAGCHAAEATVPDLATMLINAVRGVAASYSPTLHAMVDAFLVDSHRDASIWIMPGDVADTGDGQRLTSGLVETMDRSHRLSHGRPLQGVRLGLDGPVIGVTEIRAVLKAAGQ